MISRTLLTLSLLALLLTSCAPAVASAPTLDISRAYTQAYQTAIAQLQPTATPFLPNTSIPPTALRTPPALPGVFIASQLNPLDAPHTYIQDMCQYLKAKWTSANSTPGTVAMVIMFHGIIKGQAETANQISTGDFKKLMNDLHDMDFQAITTQQLADFLYTNAKIPDRSVLLVVDDRHTAENFNAHFRDYWQQ